MKRFIALVLSVSLLLCAAVPSFAAEDFTDLPAKKINYVSIGDSYSAGYYFDEYTLSRNQPVVGELFARFVCSMYSAEDAEIEKNDEISIKGAEEYFESTDDRCTVRWTNLCKINMRPDDLYFYLTDAQHKDSCYYECMAPGTEFGDELYNGVDYKRYLKEADLITLNIGYNNFYTYILRNLTEGVFDVRNDIKMICPEEYKSFLMCRQAAQNAIEDIAFRCGLDLGIMSGLTFTDIIDTAAYAYYGCIHSFDAVIDWIEANNPNQPEIYVMGLNNPLEELTGSCNGKEFSLGEVLSTVFGSVNAHFAECSGDGKRYTYVDNSEELHLFVDNILDGNDEFTSELLLNAFKDVSGFTADEEKLAMIHKLAEYSCIDFNRLMVSLREDDKDYSDFNTLLTEVNSSGASERAMVWGKLWLLKSCGIARGTCIHPDPTGNVQQADRFNGAYQENHKDERIAFLLRLKQEAAAEDIKEKLQETAEEIEERKEERKEKLQNLAEKIKAKAEETSAKLEELKAQRDEKRQERKENIQQFRTNVKTCRENKIETYLENKAYFDAAKETGNINKAIVKSCFNTLQLIRDNINLFK